MIANHLNIILKVSALSFRYFAANSTEAGLKITGMATEYFGRMDVVMTEKQF